ncbi:MAG: proline racemase family protein [Bacteroidota bacterium]
MDFSSLQAWQPPTDWRQIETVDMHTEGEPLRVILGGFPPLEGAHILDYRNYVRQHWDHLRTALMWEPRGHADMYGCLLTPPVSAEADFGTFFLHNEGYSTMCGHAIIALTTLAVETGLVEKKSPETRVLIDTPAGLVTAFAVLKGEQVDHVYFHNVPSFVLGLDQEVQVAKLGKVRYDLAYGGAFYAYVQAEEIGLSLAAENVREIIHQGMAIKRAVMENSTLIQHPFEDDLSFLYGTIFIGAVEEGSTADNRNVCIFAEGEVDRCPTGTGVSGRMAIHFARKEIQLAEKMSIESIIGSQFQASVLKTCTFGKHEAVIPQVEGRAYITGKHRFYLDPSDPLRHGFMLR